jgi:predicted dehydrogenase
MAAALTATAWGRVAGANDRIGVGIIGFGLIGRIHTRNFLKEPDVAVAGISEVYRPRMEAGAQLIGGDVSRYPDFRKMLESKDIHAVVVATPDHWHALMSLMACAAGKDVYVEKPMTLFVREGRWMVDIARRQKRVVQVGTQQRSGPHYQRARELYRSGQLGKLVSVECTYWRNLMPGFGKPPDGTPPADLDWNLFLGPAPERPYNPNRGIYHFRWFWDSSGGQMTNLGHHSLDVVHWFTGVQGPTAVASMGGRRYLEDNCEVPDTQDAILEYPGFTAYCSWRECTAGAPGAGMGGLAFHGTSGTLTTSRDGFQVIPDAQANPNNVVADILGGHPVGGPQPVPEGTRPPRTTAVKDSSGDPSELYRLHIRDFLDAIRSRKDPASDVLSGHQIAAACHLANISLLTGRRIQWDPVGEEIRGDPEASRMLQRPYRAPWDAELKALGVR